MKAIETKYIPCTNTRGSRIKAFDLDGNSVSIGYPHELNQDQAHRKAAQALADKMGWKGEMLGGYTKQGCVFVFKDNAL